MTTEAPSDTPDQATGKKRATVAGVDAKVDQILEEVDGIRIEMSQIKSAIKELVKVLVDDDDKKNPDPDPDWSMYG